MQIRERTNQLSPVDESLDQGDGGAGDDGEEDAEEDPEQRDALRRMENESFRSVQKRFRKLLSAAQQQYMEIPCGKIWDHLIMGMKVHFFIKHKK